MPENLKNGGILRHFSFYFHFWLLNAGGNWSYKKRKTRERTPVKKTAIEIMLYTIRRLTGISGFRESRFKNYLLFRRYLSPPPTKIARFLYAQ